MEGVKIFFSSDIKHEPEDTMTEKVEEALEIKTPPNDIKHELVNVPPWKLPRSCDECGKEFRSKNHLQRHVEGVHHNYKGYKCDRCDYEATDRRYVERHKAFVHENQRPTFTCNICSHQTRTLAALKSHDARRHKELPHGCTSCHYKTSDKATLKKHIAAVHEGIIYPCQLCEYKASAKNSLRNHMLAIHSGAKFQCDQCDHQTNFQSNLIQHKQAKHKASAKFKCGRCYYHAFSRNNLIQHEKDKHGNMGYLNVNLPHTTIVFIPKDSQIKQ